MKQRIRRFTAFLLAAALLLGTLTGTPKAQAQQQAKAVTFEGTDYRITLTEQSGWGSGYIAQAEITNTGSKGIHNWEIDAEIKNGTIEDVWNVTAEQENNRYLLSCQSYNRTISVGETVVFGYRAMGTGILNTTMQLKQKKKGTIDSKDYAISYYIANQWDNQANIEITVHNNTGQTINNWELELELRAVINNLWGGNLIRQEAGTVIIDGTGSSSDIEAGGSVTIGLNLTIPENGSVTPDKEVLRSTTKALIKEEDGIEETTGTEPATTESESTTQESSGKENSSGEAASGNGSPSGDASSDADTKEQDITENIDTDWDDTMIHGDADAVKQWREQAQGTVKVAILDSGIDYWNDINVVERANFVTDYEDSSLLFDDLSGHGTAAAALLAADPEKWKGSTLEEIEAAEDELEEGEEADEYQNLEEEDIDNIDLSVLQTMTSKTLTASVNQEDQKAYEELKEVLEAMAQQQEEAEQEEEDGEDESTAYLTESTDAATTASEAESTEAAPASPEASADASEPEGMEAFANLFNGDNKTVAGVNPDVDIYSARVLDDENEATIEAAIHAIEWAMEKEVQVIQIGFGIKKNHAGLYQAIQKAYKKGILIIAPAGNDATIEYPAAYEEVIAVGSVTSEGKRSRQCASGEALELMAPGEQVCSRGAFGILEPFTGTSMAVPQVTGLATLLWQKDLNQSADCIRKLMDATANSLGEPGLYGYGLIDCREAIEKYDDFVEWYAKQDCASGEAAGEEDVKSDGSGDAAGQENHDSSDSIVEQAKEELGENEEPVLVVDKDVVKGCWKGDEHRGTLTKDKKEIQALKNGITWSDNKNSKIVGMTSNPAFHGYYKKGKSTPCNYIEGYRCLVKAAQHFREHGTLTNFNYSVPAGSAGLCGMVGKLKKPWMTEAIMKQSKGIKSGGVIYTREDWEKGAYFIYGMALHTLADTFAHSTYGYNSYVYKNNNKGIRLKKQYAWTPIRHGSCVIGDTKYTLSNQSDNKKYKPQRYKQAQIAVKTALNSITSTHGTPFDNPTAGGIAVFNNMAEAVSLQEADEAESVDASGNPITVAKRDSYIKKQFGLVKFCTYLKQSYDASGDAALMQSLKKKYGEQLTDEEAIRQRWQRFDNSYVTGKIKSWKKLSFKVNSVTFDSIIQEFKIIDVTKSKKNIADNRKNKNKEGYKKKKEIVTVRLKKNALQLTNKHTYLIVLKTTKVKKSMLKKAKARTLGSTAVVENTAEQPGTFLKLFTVGEDPDEAGLSDGECILAGGTVDVVFDDADEVQAEVDGGIVTMADTADQVGKAAQNRTIRLYPWDRDFQEKINDSDEPQPVPVYETTTDSEGYYRFTGVAPGKYCMYMEDTRTDIAHYEEITVKAGAFKVHNELIRLVPNERKGKSSVTGTIRDAVGKAGVEGLEITVRTMIRTHRVRTDAQGRYTINPIFAGSYRAEVTDPEGRYAATGFTIVIDGKKQGNQAQDVFVSKKMKEGQLRIVATWGAGNTAYEGHVTMENEKNPSALVDLYHNYVNTDYELITKDGKPFAGIYGNWSSGSAPETFTLYDTTKSFDYYLYNFYGEGEKELKRELVKIEIYQGDRDKAMAVYYAPYQDGYSWKAFHYDEETGTVKQVDKLTQYPNIIEDTSEGINPWKNGWERKAVDRFFD